MSGIGDCANTLISSYTLFASVELTSHLKYSNVFFCQLEQAPSVEITNIVERAREPDQCVLPGDGERQTKHLNNPQCLLMTRTWGKELEST